MSPPPPNATARSGDTVPASRFEPVTVQGTFGPPRSSINPDQSLSWLRRALPIVKAHRMVFVTSLSLSLLGLILQVQIPDLLGLAIDNAIKAHRVPLHFYLWWVLAVSLIGGISGYIARMAMYRCAYDIEFDLRNMIFAHLTRMSFPFFDRVQTGQLISRANSDIRSVQMYLTFAPLILVQCCGALVALAYMLAINWLLALVAIAVSPLVYLVGLKMRRNMFPISWVIQARLAEVATLVDENVNGVRVVKAFAQEPHQLDQLADAADRLKWAYVKDADIRARYTPLIQNLPQMGMVLVLLVGGWLVTSGRMQLGVILTFSLYMALIQAPFMMLGMIVMMGQRAAASAGRIFEILDEKPSVVDREGATDLEGVRGEVEFRHVTFAYTTTPGINVLDDFQLHVQPGETVALVGRTGSGKSTVARLLARLYDVDQGAILVDGHDIVGVTQASLRAAVGIVLDEPFLFSASVHDNIAFGKPDASREEVARVAAAAGADQFIRELPDGYDTIVGERGYTLSGGQRQRIAIARTLLVNPPVLILDDATSAIDVQVEHEIHESLKTLMKGRTTLIIAHRLSTIGLADRVLLLDKGSVVADGTHRELLVSTPLYAEILSQAEGEQLTPDRANLDRSETKIPGARSSGTRAEVTQ